MDRGTVGIRRLQSSRPWWAGLLLAVSVLGPQAAAVDAPLFGIDIFNLQRIDIDAGGQPPRFDATGSDEFAPVIEDEPADWEDPVPDSLKGYASWFWHDTVNTLTAPLRWQGREWTGFMFVGLAVAGTMRWADRPADRYNRGKPPRSERRLWNNVSDLSANGSLVVLGGLFVAGYGFGQDRARRVWLEGVEASLIASSLLSPVLKMSVGRHRPDAQSHAFNFRPFSGNASFPSGHTTQAFAIAVVLATAYSDHPWVGITALSVAGAVGYSRLYLHKHFLSDVMAGAVLGSAVGCEVVTLHRHQAGERHGATVGFAPDRVSVTVGEGSRGVELEWDF